MEKERGRYLYGVAAGRAVSSLGPIGVKGCAVYTIPYNDFCAIVHDCSLVPYQSSDESTVKAWVVAHQVVLDEAKKRFDAVIPAGFDTIVRPSHEATSPDDVVRDWLKRDYERLAAIMEKIKGRDEYGIQIFYEPTMMAGQLAEQSEEIRKLKEEMATKSPGLAYICRQKLERAVKAEMEKLAGNRFKDFYTMVSGYCDDIVVEKTKRAEGGKVMLLNFSCLVVRQKVGGLASVLERINSTPGFSIRFTGPWPAYSFVTKLAMPAGEKTN